MRPGQDSTGSAGAPFLVVVDADLQARGITESALLRRFGSDYQVLGVGTAKEGLDALERLRMEGGQVALVAADLHLPGIDGVEFLERAHALHRSSNRVLLVAMDEYHTRVPFTELPILQRATILGRIDFWIVKGWTTPEEWLYPLVQEALTAWTMAHRPRHVVYRVVGEQWAPRSHQLRDIAARSGLPIEYYDLESPKGQRLVNEFGIDINRLPALIRHDGTVLQDPSLGEMATSHGIHIRPSLTRYDLAIVGAGPAGLGAAVYGASEGLRTVVIEREALGGQAATSSMIRNYLGFQRGIGGAELTHRGWQQAILFGAEFVFMQGATALKRQGGDCLVTLTDGTELATRACIIATGVAYRRLGIPALDRLIGAGVYYGAPGQEAPATTGEEVHVVGGANSAGQAALHLAKFAKQVTLVVRADSLASGMSDYLVKQLTATPNIKVRLHTRVVDGRGERRLEGLTLEDLRTAGHEEVGTTAVFVLIGAEPHTEWLRGTVQLSEGRFILTGRDLSPDAGPVGRTSLPFETSLPGVFAAGDVRYGSVKRVAGAVGEGSVTVGFIHQYLAEPESAVAQTQ